MRGTIFLDVLDLEPARLKHLCAYYRITHFRITQGLLKIRLILVLLSGVLLISGCSTFADNSIAGNSSTGISSAGNSSAGTSGYEEGRSYSFNASRNSIYQLMEQADSAYDSEDWLQASTSYRDVIDKVPNDAYAWFRMGNSLTQLGHYGEAVVAYETSLAADNAQFKAWFNLSTTHLLNAKVVTLNALRSIGKNDPSRNKVERRLDVLTALLN